MGRGPLGWFAVLLLVGSHGPGRDALWFLESVCFAISDHAQQPGIDQMLTCNGRNVSRDDCLAHFFFGLSIYILTFSGCLVFIFLFPLLICAWSAPWVGVSEHLDSMVWSGSGHMTFHGTALHSRHGAWMAWRRLQADTWLL